MYIPMNQDEQLENGDCGFPTLNPRTRAPVKLSFLLSHAATIRLVKLTFTRFKPLRKRIAWNICLVQRYLIWSLPSYVQYLILLACLHIDLLTCSGPLRFIMCGLINLPIY